MSASLAARWRAIAGGSTNRRIFSSALTVGTATLGVKILSMSKDMLVAGRFGAGDAMDAFAVAIILPTYAINVLSGPLSAALIPVYTQVRAESGPERAQRLLSAVTGAVLAALAGLCVILALAGPFILPLLAAGFPAGKLALTVAVFFATLPIVLLSGLAVLWEAVLNTTRQFAQVGAAGLAVPLATIAVLWLFGEAYGIAALAAGTVAGVLFQLLFLGVSLRRRGFLCRPRWCGSDPDARRVWRQYLPVMAGAAVLSSMTMIDQAVAARLSAGSVAALGYGNKLVAVIIGASTMALGTAILPYFSEMSASSDWQALRHSLRVYSRLVLLITVPLVAILCVLSEPIIALLFERGEFTAEQSALVGRVQAMYLLQIPFVTLGILFVRSISALQVTHILFWGNIISFGVNLVLDLILARSMGVAGIALATSLVYAVACAYLGTMVAVTLRKREKERHRCARRS